MPRKACIDAHGALHHIIVRGIERRYFIMPKDVLALGKYKQSVKARGLLCYCGTRELGVRTGVK